MQSTRSWFLVIAAGFTMSAVSSFTGGGPSWPNRFTWGIVASLAGAAMTAYAIWHTRPFLRIATSATIVAAFSRMIGWLVTIGADPARLVSAIGNYVIIIGLMRVVYIKARRAIT